jgi:hypothetical protein
MNTKQKRNYEKQLNAFSNNNDGSQYANCLHCGESVAVPWVMAYGNPVAICNECRDRIEEKPLYVLKGSKLSTCYKETTYRYTITTSNDLVKRYLVAFKYHHISTNKFESDNFTSLSAMSKHLKSIADKYGKVATFTVILDSRILNKTAEIKATTTAEIKTFRDSEFLK